VVLLRSTAEPFRKLRPATPVADAADGYAYRLSLADQHHKPTSSMTETLRGIVISTCDGDAVPLKAVIAVSPPTTSSATAPSSGWPISPLLARSLVRKCRRTCCA
jgi:hypothetical protein